MLEIPTIGIGAGAGTDAQVIVWQDMAGLTPGRTAKFVKKYADMHGVLLAGCPGLVRRRRQRRLPRTRAHLHLTDWSVESAVDLTW